MASQVGVPPLTGLIYGLFHSLRVNWSIIIDKASGSDKKKFKEH